MREERASLPFSIWTIDGVVSLKPQLHYAQDKNTHRRLDGPQRRSESCGEGNNLLLLSGIELRLFGYPPVAHNTKLENKFDVSKIEINIPLQ
jgi:hypothetical protein